MGKHDEERDRHRNLPARYKGRLDVPYVPRGMTVDEVGPLQDKVCALLAQGLSLRSICKREGMPSLPTIFAMVRLDPSFAQRYALAREEQAEGFADEINDIADSAQGLDSAGVNAARLRVDARKWYASKIMPKRYGDRLDVQHAGGISVAAVSKALRVVEPVTYDEEGNEVGIDSVQSTERAALSTEHAGTELAAASAVPGAEEHKAASSVPLIDPPHPLPPPPGKGTPITVTTRVTPVAQNPKIPPEIRHSSVESSTLPLFNAPQALSDLL